MYPHLQDPALHVMGSRGGWAAALGLQRAVLSIAQLLQCQEGSSQLQP